MDKKPENYRRAFAPGVPNVRAVPERLSAARSAEAQARNSHAYPEATVQIQKTDQSGQAK